MNRYLFSNKLRTTNQRYARDNRLILL